MLAPIVEPTTNGTHAAPVQALRIGIAGITGRMGQAVVAAAATDPAVQITSGISRTPEVALLGGVRLVASVPALAGLVDVLIDFSRPQVTVAIARQAADAGIPLVIGTTGLDDQQMATLRECATRIPIYYARNMSTGVNALLEIVARLAARLDGYDVEIVETHHRHKVDAPSGTALALAEAITGGEATSLVHGREGHAPRQPGEIGLHSVRAGGNAGEHTVLFANDHEEIRITHRANDRRAFAAGALRAARLLMNREPGWYTPETL
jgi:4-hydroxy-tetrahydrodipicolinate reductase